MPIKGAKLVGGSYRPASVFNMAGTLDSKKWEKTSIQNGVSEKREVIPSQSVSKKGLGEGKKKEGDGVPLRLQG